MCTFRAPEAATSPHAHTRMLRLHVPVLAGTWAVLTGADASAHALGVLAVLGAAAWGVKLTAGGARAWRPLAVARLPGTFLLGSFRGGMDVAWRAFRPGRTVRPHLAAIEPRLPPGTARELWASLLTLMPGTLLARGGSTSVLVHFLSWPAPRSLDALRELERRVAASTGTPLEVPRG